MIDSTEEILSLQRIQNRLQSTSNHELPSLLSKLLPNLLPLANKEGLRNATVSVISDCIRRIKSSKCIIDLVPIITACINPALLPFACNFSFTLIDIVLPFILEQSTVVSIKESTEMNLTAALYDSNKALTQAIVCAIGLFEEFTIQSNSLCFYILQLLDYLPSAMDQLTRKLDSSVDLKKIKDVIGNCAIDVCLLYRSLSVDGNAIIGSIQPGLSSLHIDRLNIRMKSMPLPFLNDLKLKLLSFVPFTYIFHPHHAVLLSIISVNDPTTDIATQGMYKMNGVVNFYHFDKDETAALAVMEYLLTICLPDSSTTIFNSKNINNSVSNSAATAGKRSLMRREIRATALRWLAKHFSLYLINPIAVKGVIMILFKLVFPQTTENFSSLLVEDIIVLNANLRLVDVITKKLSHEELGTIIMLIFQCVKKLLHSFSTSFQANQISNESSAEIDLRIACYGIIENISQRMLSITEVSSSVIINNIEKLRNQYRKFITEDSDLLIVLFKLLEKETLQQHGRASVVSIHSTLSVLRQAYTTSSDNSSLKAASKLQEILKKVRNSPGETKVRIIALQWTKAIFGWDAFTIETLIDLIDDQSPQVAILAISEFRNLKKYCLENDATTCSVVIKSLLDFASHLNQESKALVYLFDIISKAIKLLLLENKELIYLPLLARLMKFIADLEFLIDSNSLLSCEFEEECFFSSVENQVYPISTDDMDTKSSYRTEEKSELTKLKVLRSITSLLQSIHKMVHLIAKNSDTDAVEMKSIFEIRKISLRLIPFYLNWLHVPEYQMRNDIGGILSLLCFIVDDRNNTIDLNFIGSLSQNLIRNISTNLFCAAGSIISLGYLLVEMIRNIIDGLDSGTPSIELDALLRDSKQIHAQLFSFINKFINIFINSEGNSHDHLNSRVLQFVVIETMILLANNGYIDAAELLQTEMNGNDGANFDHNLFIKKNSFIFKKYFKPSYQSNVATFVKTLIKHTDNRIAAFAIEFFSKLSLYYNPKEFISLLWSYLQDPDLRHRKSYIYRFAWGEAVFRVSLTGSMSDLFLKQIEEEIILGSKIENDGVGILDKSMYCVWLLILTKELIHPDVDFNQKQPLSFDLFKRLLLLFLKLLKENDVFIQDICCYGICYLYYISRKERLYLTQCLNELTGTNDACIRNYVTELVISTLTREKRSNQPVGYTVAGTASDNTAISTTTNNATSPENRNTTTTENRDPLLQAAAVAAAELGVNLTFVADEFGNSNRTEQIPQDYVIYSTVCKLVRKTKSNDILFLVLSLIKRDPTLSLPSNQSMLAKYSAPFTYYESNSEIDTFMKISRTVVDILPTLYHAKFDPNNTVRPVMIDLWKTMINKFISQHEFSILDLIQSKIVTYLIQCLHSKLWRDREAACLAFESFLPQRSWSISIFPFLNELFCSGLRVLDDVRDSTRLSALSFMKVLCNHMERACNPVESCELTVDTAIKAIIPLILEKGLIHTSPEARGLCLGLLSKIIRVSKTISAIRKWLPNIISILIESMSALEPQTLQYMQFHTTRLRISDEELETMRIKMSQSSPLQEALDTCIVILNDVILYDTDATIISEVIACLSSAVRCGVGLATRVSAAQSIVQIVERYPKFLVKGSAGESSTTKAFTSVVWVLTQMSSAIAISLKKSITSAFGALSKVVDEDVLASECEALISRYMTLESAHLEQSTTLAECIQQIVQRSGSRLAYVENSNQDIWTLILSTAFMGTHDFDSNSKSIWISIWDDSLISSGIGSKISCLLKIFPQLLEIVLNLLNELSWHRRVQGISIFRDLIQFLSVEQITLQLSSESINSKFAKLIYTLLLLIPGKVWEGQSFVLEVLSDVFNKCRDYVCWSSSIHSIESIDSLVPVFDANINNDHLKLENIVDFQPNKYKYRMDDHSGLLIAASKDPYNISDNKVNLLWQVHFMGWFMVLVSECQRISAGTEYTLVASRALNSLPWQYLSNLDQGALVYLQILPLLCKYAGISIYKTIPISSKTVALTMKPVIANSYKLKIDINGKNKRLLGNDALFGGAMRYKVGKEEGYISTQTLKSTHQQPQQHLLSNQNAAVANNNVIDPIQLEFAESNVDQRSNVKLASLDSDLQQMEETRFPAFKCFFVESIVKGWPRIAMISYLKANVEHSENTLLYIGSNSIAWSYKMLIECEIWSLKKAAILLVGTISSSLMLSVSDLSQVISILELTIEETKFVKVRVEALKSIALLLKGPNLQQLNDDESFSQRIREIIKTTSSDHQPTVLEAVSKIQNLWLR